MEATVRVNNPTEEDNPTEQDRTDGMVKVGTDESHARDVENIKAATTPTDRGEVVELMRAQDGVIASKEANTAGPIENVGARLQCDPHR